MPDDRFFHRRLLSSQKVASIGLLGRIVWEDLRLLADDFGVVPLRLSILREDRGLNGTADADLADAIERVLAAGLFLRFEHQGEPFACDPRWQEFERIRWPRKTHWPAPPPETFAQLDKKTQKLFRSFHGGFRKNFKKFNTRSRDRSLAKAKG